MIERQRFGRTGHASSRVIFGAAALSRATQEQADAVLPLLDEFGVNHLDVAASYGDAELRLAPWLATRTDFFVATKTGERTGDGARKSLDRSLQRLGVDSIDLIQLHNLVEPDEWGMAHSKGGAVEALVTAREEGLVRWIGVTGHGLRIPSMHLRSLERFDFDSVLFPLNHSLLQDDGYRSDVESLLAVASERDVAVQTIKSVARRRWPDETERPRYSWYEPLRDAEAIGRAVNFTLATPSVFLNSSSDRTVLRATLEAAAGPRSEPNHDDLAADERQWGITPLFDGSELERI